MSKRGWLELREAAVMLLIQGLGYYANSGSKHVAATILSDVLPQAEGHNSNQSAGESIADTPPIHNFEPIHWPDVYKAATGLLGKTEAEFWQMTMCGLLLQAEAHAASQGIAIAQVGAPATPDDLRDMMAQYPDAANAA